MGRALALLAAVSCASSNGCASAPAYPESDHYKDGRFFNTPPIEALSPLAVGRHILFGRNGKWPGTVENKVYPPIKDRDSVGVTFIGHATMLIQQGELAILTDPVWSERVGPSSWAGPKRVRHPGVAFEMLPKIAVVLISHNHFDHLDLPTLVRLEKRDQPMFIVPLGLQSWLQGQGLSRVQELDWWESAKVSPRVNITLAPAQHNSGRGLFDHDCSLWGSFWIQTPSAAVYFGGDTAYAQHFSKIRDRLGRPDLALLPIGGYSPTAMMHAFHMDPKEAIQAALDLGASRAIGIHYGLFQTTNEDFDEPEKLLKEGLKERQLPDSFFFTLDAGQSWEIAKRKEANGNE